MSRSGMLNGRQSFDLLHALGKRGRLSREQTRNCGVGAQPRRDLHRSRHRGLIHLYSMIQCETPSWWLSVFLQNAHICTGQLQSSKALQYVTTAPPDIDLYADRPLTSILS